MRFSAFPVPDASLANAIIASQYKLTPLSAWGKPYTPPANAPVDTNIAPVDTVAAMDAPTFFNHLAMLMKDNLPAPADAPMVAKLALRECRQNSICSNCSWRL